MLKLGLEQERASDRNRAKEKKKGSSSSSRSTRKKKIEIDEETHNATALDLTKKSGSWKDSTPSGRGQSSSRSHEQRNEGLVYSTNSFSQGFYSSWNDPRKFGGEPWLRYGGSTHILEPNAVWIYMTPNRLAAHPGRRSLSLSDGYTLNVSYLPPDFATVAGLIPEAIICYSKVAHAYDKKDVAANVSRDITDANFRGNIHFKEILFDTVREFGNGDPAWDDLVYEDSPSAFQYASVSLASSRTLKTSSSDARSKSSRSQKAGTRLFGYRDGRSPVSCEYKPSSSASGCSNGFVDYSDIICCFLFDYDKFVTKAYDCGNYRVVTSNGPPRLSSHIHEKLIRKLYRMTIEQAQQRRIREPVTLVSTLDLNS